MPVEESSSSYDVERLSQVLAGLASDGVDSGVQRALSFLEKQRGIVPTSTNEQRAATALGAFADSQSVKVLARWQTMSAVLGSLASSQAPCEPLPESGSDTVKGLSLAVLPSGRSVDGLVAVAVFKNVNVAERTWVPTVSSEHCVGYYLIAQTNLLRI